MDFGATGAILSAEADVVNAGSTIGSGTGKVNLSGTVMQNITGSGTLGAPVWTIRRVRIQLVLLSCASKLNIVNGKMNTGSDTIYLASAVQMTEAIGGIENYVLGNLKMYRNVGVSAETFGGMGCELTAGSNLGLGFHCPDFRHSDSWSFVVKWNQAILADHSNRSTSHSQP